MTKTIKDTENFGTFEDMQIAILSGETIEFERGLWRECEVYRFITDYLSNKNHNGVVITGCDPWLVSVMTKPKPNTYSPAQFEQSKFYTRNNCGVVYGETGISDVFIAITGSGLTYSCNLSNIYNDYVEVVPTWTPVL